VYWGPANQAVDYFASIGLTIPAYTNPCDWFMNITHINPIDPTSGMQSIIIYFTATADLLLLLLSFQFRLTLFDLTPLRSLILVITFAILTLYRGEGESSDRLLQRVKILSDGKRSCSVQS
jgi:hypothetical protein